MANKTFYLSVTTASNSNHHTLQDGGEAPSDARLTTGWVVGTEATMPRYGRMDSGTECAATAMLTTPVEPSGSPDNTLGDCFRSASVITGAFAGGNWAISAQVQGESRATGTHDGRIRFRVWRAVDATGASPSEITSGSTSTYTNLANSTAQTLTASAAASAITFTNEYLFLQIAHQQDGAGDHNLCDTHMCVGASNTLITTDYSLPSATVTPASIGSTVAVANPDLTAPTVYTVDNANIFWSPENWYFNGSTYALTNNTGAYLKVNFTGTGLAVGIDISVWQALAQAANRWPILTWKIDGGDFQHYQTITDQTSQTLATGLANTAHTAQLWFRAVTPGIQDRWNTPSVQIRITSLTVTGGTLTTPTVATKRWLFFGDSLTEGTNCNGDTYLAGINDGSNTFAQQVSQALDAEVGTIGFVSQGYMTLPNAGHNITYFHQTGGSHTWHQQFLNQARDFSNIDAVFFCHGTNDVINAVDSETLETHIEDLLTDFRAANASTTMYLVVPFCGIDRSTWQEAFADYQSATLDENCFLVDVIDQENATFAEDINGDETFGSTYTADGLHPNQAGHDYIAGLLEANLRRIAPAGIASTTVLANPDLGATANITPVGITSTVAVANPDLTAESSGEDITPAGIATTAALANPDLTATASITPVGIASTVSLANPEVITSGDYLDIERKVGVEGAWATLVQLPLTDSEYDDTDEFVDGTTYYYRIRKIESSVTGPWSNEDEVTFTTGATITPAGIASTINLGDFTLTAGATSITPASIATTAALANSSLSAGATAITPAGIATTNALGSPSLAATASITPAGIAPTASIGTPSLVASATTITVDGIASTVAVANPTMSAGATVVTVDGIAATSALGTPSITASATNITPAGIASTVAVANPSFATGTASITLDGIAATNAIGTPSLSAGATTITLDGIGSTTAVANPLLSEGMGTVTLEGIGSTSDIGTPSLVASATTVTVAGIASTSAVANPTLTQGAGTVTVEGIDSTNALGNPTLSATSAIALEAISSSIALGNLSLIASATNITLDGIASTVAVSNPSLSEGMGYVSLAGIASTAAIANPSLTAGATSITLDGIASTAALANIELSAIATLSLDAISSAIAVSNPTLTATGVITPAGIAPTSALANPTLTVGATSLTPSSIDSTVAFGDIDLASTVALTPAGIASTIAIGTPTLTVGAATITPDAISSTIEFGTLTMSRLTVQQRISLNGSYTLVHTLYGSYALIHALDGSYTLTRNLTGST